MVDAEDFEWLSCFRWHLKSDGYVARNMRHPLDPAKQATMLLSRAIMGLGYGGPWKVDHRDHDLLNNCKSNLRVCTHQQNHENRRAEGVRGSTSRYRGVCWDAGKERWVAYGYRFGERTHLGYFEDENEAGQAAADWRRDTMTHSMN